VFKSAAFNHTLTIEKLKMSKHSSNENRRKLLKTIVTGSGAVVAGNALPEGWAKPVVDSVILPAHAETTCASTLTLVVTEPGGAVIPSGRKLAESIGNLLATVTVIPYPGDGQLASFDYSHALLAKSEILKDGPNGKASIIFPFGHETIPGTVETISASFDCAKSNTWTATVVKSGSEDWPIQ